MDFCKKILLRNRQFILYCLIGGTGASLDFFIFSMLVMKAHTHHQLANVVGYACGSLWSFALNAHFNFKTRDRLGLRLLSFCSVAFLGWAASAGVLYGTVDVLEWNKYAAKIVTLAVVVVVQYNLNRLVSFRKNQPTN